MWDYYKEYKRKKWCFAAALILGIVVTAFWGGREIREQQLQKEIAAEVIRFHVRANSDSYEDQELKRNVRDALLSYLEGVLKGSENVEMSRELLEEHLEEIKAAANACISQRGFIYPVNAYLVKEKFPEKTYGDCRFPEGIYEALRVDIGAGKGSNWWCMVYPGLCFTEETGAFVSEDGKEMLKHVLTEEEFDFVTEKQNIRFRFKLLKFLK